MTGYVYVVGGSPIQPVEPTYRAISLSASVTLQWPLENAVTDNYVADVMDVTPSANGFSITMPDATGTSTGSVSVISNLSGSYSFSVNNSLGVSILTLSPGTVWYLYLRSNSNAVGTWGAFQFGAQSASINLAAIAGSGLQAVSSTLSQALPVTGISSNYTATTSDRAKVFVWSAGAGTFTLPSAATAGNNFFLYIKNLGSGNLLLSATAGNVDGAASLSIPSTNAVGVIVFCDGSNYYTIGYNGSGSSTGFDYTSINVAGTGNYTLAGGQLNRISYLLTGILTGNRTVIVPASVQQYWINNQTTGAYTLSVKANGSAATPITVQQGQSAIVYCDGTDVIAGQSGITLPVAVASGGTGATTASGARTNLGSTATGDALFTAVSASAARTTLGAGAVGANVFTSASVAAAVSALSSGQVTVDGANSWNFGAATAAGTLKVTAASSYPGLYVLSAGGDNGRMALVATGVREWWAYAANADGSFRIADFTGSLEALKITTAGQASVYEPSYGVLALAEVSTKASGSFTGTLTGMTGTVTGTFYWRRVDGLVTLYCSADVTGTSNTTTMTLTGLPATISASSTVVGAGGWGYDNGVGNYLTTFSISGTTVTINNGTAGIGGWTGSGTKGLMAGWSVVYHL